MSTINEQILKAASGKKKRRLTKLRIDEFACVDRPAMEGAVALLMKRAPIQKYSDEQPRAEDGKWTDGGGGGGSSGGSEGGSALPSGERSREALKEKAMSEGTVESRRVAAGDWRVYSRMGTESFLISTHTTKQGARAAAERSKKVLSDGGKLTPHHPLNKRAYLTTSEEGHSHLIDLEDYSLQQQGIHDGRVSGTTSYSMADGAEREHTHPWVMDEAGEITIGESDGHNHSISVVSKSLDSEEQLVEALKNLSPGEDEDIALAYVQKRAGELGVDFEEVKKAARYDEEDEESEEEEEDMAGTVKKTDAERIEGLEKRVERNDAILALPADQQAIVKAKKTDEEKDKFLAMKEEEREAETKKVAALAKAAEGETEVVYKSLAGVEFTKKHDPMLVALAKSNDDLTTKLAKSENERELQALQKRAESELGHLPGTIEARVALLKSIDGITDATQRQSALEAVKAGDYALSKAFDVRGVVGGTLAETSAEGKLEKMVKNYVEKNPTATEAVAYDEVLKTTEGKELYAKSVEEKEARR